MAQQPKRVKPWTGPLTLLDKWLVRPTPIPAILCGEQMPYLPTSLVEIFLAELPDHRRELSSQSCHDLKTFTPFPRLPTELRLRIWRCCFPKSRLVTVLTGAESNCPCCERPFQYEAKNMFPIGLHINKESRDETLGRYISFWYNTDGSGSEDAGREVENGPGNFFCLNPLRDKLYFHVASLYNIGPGGRVPDWASKFRLHSSSFPSKVEKVLIRQWDSSDEEELVVSMNDPCGDGCPIYPSILTELLAFEDLKEVEFVYSHRSYDLCDEEEDTLTSTKEKVTQWMEYHKKDFGGKEPQVVASPWRYVPL